MNIPCTLIQINTTKSYGANNFLKREVVIETHEQYPQKLLIEFTQSMTAVLDQYQAGQNVNIDINLKGREWVNGAGEIKYFNSIQGWKISRFEKG